MVMHDLVMGGCTSLVPYTVRPLISTYSIDKSALGCVVHFTLTLSALYAVRQLYMNYENCQRTVTLEKSS